MQGHALHHVMDALHEHEIGFLIEHVPCTGFTVRLGDEMNGYVETGSFKDLWKIPGFLAEAAKKHFDLDIPTFQEWLERRQEIGGRPNPVYKPEGTR